jgi:hypothetical protein
MTNAAVGRLRVQDQTDWKSEGPYLRRNVSLRETMIRERQLPNLVLMARTACLRRTRPRRMVKLSRSGRSSSGVSTNSAQTILASAARYDLTRC